MKRTLFPLPAKTRAKNLERARARRDELAAQLVKNGLAKPKLVEQLCLNPLHLGMTIKLLGFVPNAGVPPARAQSVATEIAFLVAAREVARLEAEAARPPATAAQEEMAL